MMRLNLAVVAFLVGGCAAGPDQELEPGSELPLQISVQTSVSPIADPNVTITVDLRNLGPKPVALRVRCTVIEIDQDQSGEWKRLGDLRLCLPANQTTLPAGATLTAADQRSLSPGNYRVAIDATDGRTAVSKPFRVYPVR